MKELLLIPVILAVFAFGYVVMTRVDRFMEENRRRVYTENRQNRLHLRIAAESPALLDSIAAQLAEYSDANPFVEFFLSTGRAEHLLQKLAQGALDLVLLEEEKTAPDECCALIRIPCRTGTVVSESLGLPVESHDRGKWACIVWNKTIPSKVRDRVLFTIEAECCSLKCGYADYLS